jgi:uncharacterized integral membrane protein
MKNFKIIVSVILLILVLIFSMQNLGLMTVNLFNWSVSLPKAIVVILVYILGMMTGGMTFSLIKALVTAGRKEKPAEQKG